MKYLGGTRNYDSINTDMMHEEMAKNAGNDNMINQGAVWSGNTMKMNAAMTANSSMMGIVMNGSGVK